jgi:hypothetical protein
LGNWRDQHESVKNLTLFRRSCNVPSQTHLPQTPYLRVIS